MTNVYKATNAYVYIYIYIWITVTLFAFDTFEHVLNVVEALTVISKKRGKWKRRERERKKKWWQVFIITLALWSTDEKLSRETGTVSRGYIAPVMTFNIYRNIPNTRGQRSAGKSVCRDVTRPMDLVSTTRHNPRTNGGERGGRGSYSSVILYPTYISLRFIRIYPLMKREQFSFHFIPDNNI